MDEIHGWPKTDLHCHLDGSLRPATLVELAAGVGLDLGEGEEGARRAVRAGALCESLVDYLEAFRLTLAVLQSATSLRQVARELVEDAASENVRVLELRFCPLLHLEGGLFPEAVVESVLEGVAEGTREALRRARQKMHPSAPIGPAPVRTADPTIRAGVILCAMRERDPAETQRVTELAVRYQSDGVVGVDLAGPEAGHPAGRHARAFERAAEAGLGVTVHAGEADGPESVWAALVECGALRVGHGCRSIEDPDLVQSLAERGVTVEVCPGSNLQTRAVETLEHHPAGRLRSAGVMLSVATDNRLVTDTTVTQELRRLAGALELDKETLKDIVLAGFEAAFLPEEARRALATEAAREIDGPSRMGPPTLPANRPV